MHSQYDPESRIWRSISVLVQAEMSLNIKHSDPEPAHADTILNERIAIMSTSILSFLITSLPKLFEILPFIWKALQDLQG